MEVELEFELATDDDGKILTIKRSDGTEETVTPNEDASDGE